MRGLVRSYVTFAIPLFHACEGENTIELLAGLTDLCFLLHRFLVLQIYYYLLLHLGRFFCFFILYTVSRTRVKPVARPLPTYRTAQTRTKRTETSMPWVGFEPTFTKQSVHRWRWGCQPYAPAALYPQEDSWYSFVSEAESTPRAMLRLEGLGILKKSTSSGLEIAIFRHVA
jgi:hypothetical protein